MGNEQATTLQKARPESTSTGAPLSKAQIAELKMKHGDELVSIEQPEGTFVFRAPSRAEWRRYMNTLTNDRRNADKAAGHDQICCDTLVYPTGASPEEPDVLKLRTLFEKKPGLPVTIAAELGDLAGAGESVAVKKL